MDLRSSVVFTVTIARAKSERWLVRLRAKYFMSYKDMSKAMYLLEHWFFHETCLQMNQKTSVR